MAKKKKQQKAGLAKRKVAKQHKKKDQKKKSLAKPAQKKMSMSKMKKTLRQIPKLVFEPEIQKCGFNAEDVRRAAEEYQVVPEQIESVYTPEFEKNLLETLKGLEVDATTEGDKERELMLKSLTYYMESGQSQPNFNQLVVGLYLIKYREVVSQEEPLNEETILEVLDDYEATWKEFFKEHPPEMTPPGQEMGGIVPPDGEYEEDDGEEEEDEDEDEEEFAALESAFEDLVSDFEAYQLEKTGDSDKVNQMLDDVQAFLQDYLEEKSITSLSKVNGEMVQNFLELEGWYIERMNPSPGDMDQMINSLHALVEFGKEKAFLGSNNHKSIIEVLANKRAS